MIGYFFDLAEAEDYFLTERLDSEAWDDLVGVSPKNEKEAVLTQAFNRIIRSPLFTVPAPADADSAELEVLRTAQAEYAYYLAVHLRDEDRRKGIQAQGVVEAGIVKEKYSEGMLDLTPVPQFVRDLLTDFATPVKHFVAVDIERDEGRPAAEDVWEPDPQDDI